VLSTDIWQLRVTRIFLENGLPSYLKNVPLGKREKLSLLMKKYLQILADYNSDFERKLWSKMDGTVWTVGLAHSVTGLPIILRSVGLSPIKKCIVVATHQLLQTGNKEAFGIVNEHENLNWCHSTTQRLSACNQFNFRPFEYARK